MKKLPQYEYSKKLIPPHKYSIVIVSVPASYIQSRSGSSNFIKEQRPTSRTYAVFRLLGSKIACLSVGQVRVRVNVGLALCVAYQMRLPIFGRVDVECQIGRCPTSNTAWFPHHFLPPSSTINLHASCNPHTHRNNYAFRTLNNNLLKPNSS